MKRKLIYVISTMLIVVSLVGCGAKKEAELEITNTNEVSADNSQEENVDKADTKLTEEEKVGTDQKDSDVEEMFSTVHVDNGVSIRRYNGTEENAMVEIPSEIDGENVVEIDGGAFANNETIKELVIPDTVKIIGSGAFIFCTNLEKVTLGTGIEEVEDEAFEGCSKLTSLDFSEGLKKIGSMAITCCEALVYVNVPKSVEEIVDPNFAQCSDNLVVSVTSGSVAEEYVKTWDYKYEVK